MYLFRQYILFLCIFFVSSTIASNSVSIDTNNGNVNIKFDSLSDEAKVSIYAKAISDEVTRAGNSEYSKGELERAKALFYSASIINPDNFSALRRLYKVKLKLAEGDAQRTSLYNEILAAGRKLGERTSDFNAEIHRNRAILYRMAASLYEETTEEHKKANAAAQQERATLSRASVNDIGTLRAHSELRDDADRYFNNKEYFSAIFVYAQLYRSSNEIYCLNKIAEVINILDQSVNEGAE